VIIVVAGIVSVPFDSVIVDAEAKWVESKLMVPPLNATDFSKASRRLHDASVPVPDAA
jgi:hypothetical protein